MVTNVGKFKNYLEEYGRSLYLKYIDEDVINHVLDNGIEWGPEFVLACCNKEDKNRFARVNGLINFLQCPDALIQASHCVYGDFETLSHYLYYSGMYTNQCFDILVYVIKKSLSDDFYIKPSININDLLSYNFRNIKSWQKRVCYEDVVKIIGDRLPEKLCRNSQKKAIRKVALMLAERHDSALKKSYRDIEEHFLKKQTTFLADDIEIICKAFENLGVEDVLVVEIKRYLEQRMNNRTRQRSRVGSEDEARPTKKQGTVMRAIAPVDRTSDEEIWIRSKINLKTLEPIEDGMCLADRIRVVVWLMKDDVAVSDIKNNFLKVCDERIIFEGSALAKYHELLPKFNYWCQEGFLNKQLLVDMEVVSKYVEEGNDIGAWLRYLRELVNEASLSIPNNYKYEISEAERIIKEEKQKKGALVKNKSTGN